MDLMGTLDTLPAKRREGVVEWCVKRQVCTMSDIARLLYLRARGFNGICTVTCVLRITIF